MAPRINATCEENNVGNHILRWNISPVISGTMKVYASPLPDTLLSRVPVGMAKISDKRVTIISDNPSQRTYYTLVFNDKYTVKVAKRYLPLSGVQNFRDLGGYHSMHSDKDMRWGMLYRSAQIDTFDSATRRTMKSLGIRTVIDLRSSEEAASKPDPSEFKVVSIPIAAGNLPVILKELISGQVKSDTINRIAERVNRSLASDFQKEYKQMFDVLLDRSNYPILIHCTSGKGRTGFASALIMAALNVNEDLIMADYQLSNSCFDIRKAFKIGERMPVNIQEAITTLFSAREAYLDAAWDEALREYGSIPAYLQKGIGLSPEDIEKLRSLLLVSENNS